VEAIVEFCTHRKDIRLANQFFRRPLIGVVGTKCRCCNEEGGRWDGGGRVASPASLVHFSMPIIKAFI